MAMRIDPQALAEAMTIFQDENSRTMTEENRLYVTAMVKKWAPLMGESFLGLKIKPVPPKMWPAMAIAFENQVLANPTPKSLYEATVKSDITLPTKYTLPIIRQVFPNLIMMKIASVQPMPKMSGGVMQLFWMDFQREDKGNENVTVIDSTYAQRNENAVPKRLKMAVHSHSATATKDILNATWSMEVEEDAMGALGIDVEAELVEEMAAEILREIESRVLNEILVGATAGNANWSWTVPATYTAATWYETLYHSIIDADNYIWNNRHRSADYIICGTTFAGYLQKTEDFTSESEPDQGPVRSGVQRIGTFRKMWDVYKTPYINAQRAIVSYYPVSMLHAGYIWAPYIPLMPMPKVYAEMEPYNDATLPGAYVNTDKWNRNVRTRNAKYFCAPEMFATLSIAA